LLNYAPWVQCLDHHSSPVLVLSSDLTAHLESSVGPPLIGALLRMPVDAIRERMLAGLHEAGFTDLVSAHFAVLRYPGPENKRPSEVAAEAGMTKQATNYLLGQLEQLGYLSRDRDPADHRSKRVHLTERGRAAAKRIRTTVGQIESELERELGSQQFAQLRQLLTRLNATNAISHQA
jgi:DNA-binding MarR family transcriptional regulator